MTGHWTIVTGGNRGIGLQVCKELVRSGRRVLLCSRDARAGKEAASALTSSADGKGECRSLTLDISSPVSIESFVKAVQEEYDQQVQAIVNNAGYLEQSWDQDTFQHTVATNVRGPVDLTLQLAPHMVTGGRVVMVSSGLGSLSSTGSEAYRNAVSGAQGFEELTSITFNPTDPGMQHGYATYNLSKAMLNRATQLLASDAALTSRGITCNAVSPGWVRTRMGSSAAPRSVEQGARSILLVLDSTADPPLNGTFSTDGQQMSW